MQFSIDFAEIEALILAKTGSEITIPQLLSKLNKPERDT